MNKKCFLIIGCGGSGQRYARNMERIFPDGEIYIWNTGKQKVSNIDGVEKVIIISDEKYATEKEYAAVFIATPTSTHIKYAEMFFDQTDVFIIDKPLDVDMAKCELFKRNALREGKKVFVNFQRRYVRLWGELNKYLENDILGEFRYGNVNINSYMPSWRNKDYHQLYAAKKELGGGVLLTECHEIDLVQWCLGNIKSVNASANYTNAYEMDVEDAIHFTAYTETKYGERPITFKLDFMNQELTRKIVLTFVDGVIELDEIEHTLTVKKYQTNTIVFKDHQQEDYHVAFLKDVKAYLDSNTIGSNLADINAALKVNGVICACKESRESKKNVVVVDSIFPKEGLKVLNEICIQADKIFGDRLIAIYGMGSLGYGGYVEGWSDFDIDIIVDIEDVATQKNHFYQGKEIQNSLITDDFDRLDLRVYSYKFLNEKNTILTYGQCSRAVMLCDSARLIIGRDIRNEVMRPTIMEILEEEIGLVKSFLSREEEWWSELPWDDIAAFYALIARFMYSKDTGKVAGKKHALDFFIKNYIHQYPVECVQWFVWAYCLRDKNNEILLQESYKQNCIKSLQKCYHIAYEILKESLEEM